MTLKLSTAIFAGILGLASPALATSIPAIDGNYEGNYDIGNAFGGHGLWLPGFLGDKTWSVSSGSANYVDGVMTMAGTVENGGYSLDFDFKVQEIADHDGELVCGFNQACQNATDEMKDNIVFFDMGANDIMGTITGTVGTALEGLLMTVVMRPLPDKPGQLGFGGNWTTLDFGYSNWMYWSVVDGVDNIDHGMGGNGDVNFDFLGNNVVVQRPPEVPLPAGLPLLLTAATGFGALRMRQRRG